MFIIIFRHTAWLKDSEAVTPKASMEKVFLKVSYNVQENICVEVSFKIKLQAGSLQILQI